MSRFTAFRKMAMGVLALAPVVLLLAFAGQASVAAAQLRMGDNFSISAGTGFEGTPSVAVNPDNGKFLVAWTSTEPGASSSAPSFNRVLARLVSPAGTLLAQPIVVTQRVSTDAAFGGSNPSAVYNAVDGEFLVVYERSYEGSSDSGIFAQRIGTDGILQGDEIALFRSLGQTSPVIAHDPVNNRYLAAWSGRNNTVLFGGLLSNAGIPLGPVNEFTPLGQLTRNPAITFNEETGRYLLVYEVTSNTVADIAARLFDSDGRFASAPFSVSTEAGAQLSPQVLFNKPAHQFLVSWSDDTGRALSQLVEAGGALSGNPVVLRGNAAFPLLANSTQQPRYFLNWVSRDAASPDNGFLLGRFLAADLNPDSAAFRISANSAVAGKTALAIYQRDSVGLSVWPRTGQNGNPRIWGQLINLSTTLTKLSVTVTTTPKTATAGQPLTYRVRIKNKGRAAGQAVELTDSLPAGTSLVSATPSTGSCSQAGSTVSCALGNLPVNGTATVDVVVIPRQVGINKNKVILDWGNNAADASKTSVTSKTKVAYPGSLSVLSPNGGETLPAGAPFDVVWEIRDAIAGDTLRYKLQYSTNKGRTWKTVAKNLSETRFPWTVPTPRGNRLKSLVRVIGSDSVNARIGVARSDAPFAIEVLRLNAPATGDTVSAGQALNVVWTTRGTAGTVGKVVLSYSRNGGRTWNKIAVVQGNPGSYLWTAPSLGKPSPKSRVRVVLKNARGATLASVSSGLFTILP